MKGIRQTIWLMILALFSSEGASAQYTSPLSMAADRSRARLSDFVSFTVTYANPAEETLLDMQMLFTIPEPLRLIQNTISGTRNKGTRSGLQHRITFDEIGPKERINVRFLARVAGGTAERKVLARVELYRGTHYLGEATETIEILRDPVLESSSIIGRVFCDGESREADGERSGWQDSGEEGLFGARVYLDTGFYADTDQNGLFHFSSVPSGTRLVKLDQGSLPRGSRILSPERLQLFLTKGVPAKVRFAVDCKLDTWSSPDAVYRAGEEVLANASKKADAPSPAVRALELSVDADKRTIRFGHRRYVFLHPQLEARSVTGGVRFFPSLESPLTPSRWRIRVFDVDDDGNVQEELLKQDLTGRGPPPLFVDFFPSAVGTERGTSVDPRYGARGAYRAFLEVHAGESDWARSRAIDVLHAPHLTRTTITDAGSIATPDVSSLPKAIDTLLPEWQEKLEQPVSLIVEGHWDLGGSAEEAFREAKRIAEHFRDLLVERGIAGNRIITRSRGGEQPLVPNLSRALRLKNRRLLFFWQHEVAPALPMEATEPRHVLVTIDRQDARIMLEAPKQTFTVDLDVPAQVCVSLDDGTGASSTMQRVVTDNWVTRPVEREAVLPTINREEGVIQLGLSQHPLPKPPPQLLQLILLSPSAPLLVVTTSAATDLQKWRLVLQSHSGRTLDEVSGSAPLPQTINLSITSTVVTNQSVELRLYAEHRGGYRSISAPVVLPPIRVDSPLFGRPRTVLEATVEERIDLVGAPPRTGPIEVSERSIRIGDSRAAHLIVPIPLLKDLARVPMPTDEPKNDDDDDEEEPDPTAVIDAARLMVRTSHRDQQLDRLELPLTGETVPSNRVSINGKTVVVSAEGRFAHIVSLSPGRNTVEIKVEDAEQNSAVYRREFTTTTSAFFLLGLAEGTVALDRLHLAGSNEHTRFDVENFGFDAQLTLYGHARFIAPSGPFRDIRVKGRIATGELDTLMIERTDDPLRLLPAFGDAAREVQDISSRYKVHLDLALDDSRIILANRSTELSSLEQGSLFNWRRSGFGVHGELRRSSSVDQTEVKGAALVENQAIARGHDELQGTGGSMYWLAHDEILEGSDRVHLLVRDRDTGLVLLRLRKQRGRDYEIRPREGRIVLREPLPHVVAHGPSRLNRTMVMEGHPTYLVVDYEYHQEETDDRSFGITVRETLFDQLEIFFGTAVEEKPDQTYRLTGVAAAWRPTKSSFLELEYAQSEGYTTLGHLSVDGGLTFETYDERVRSFLTGAYPQLPFSGALDNHAFAFTGALDLADVTKSQRGHVKIYGRKAGLGFSAPAALRDAGRLQGGAAASLDLSERVTLRGRADAAVTAVLNTTLPFYPLEAPSMLRALAVGGLDYRGEDQSATFEVAHLHSTSVAKPVELTSNATALSGRYEHYFTDDFTLSFAQDVLFGDDLVANTTDLRELGRVASTIGLTYNLNQDISISAAETVRWNGDNATEVGLRAQTDGFSTYVAERLSHAKSQPMLSTILGAEDEIVKGSRTYGEIQFDGAHHSTTRAVLGMDNRWAVTEGLDLMLAYERAQIMAKEPVLTRRTMDPFLAPLGGLSSTLGGFGSSVRLLPDAVSRDALVVGASTAILEGVKLSSRFELRSDRGTGANYLTIGVHGGAAIQPHRDITCLVRFTTQHVKDTDTNTTYAKMMEWSAGATLRPRHNDWFTLVLRYTRVIGQRPPAPDTYVETRDAISITPIFDTPFGVQLLERAALVHTDLKTPNARSTGVDLLWINRINARFFTYWELGVEYRLLKDLTPFEADTQSIDHTDRGFLVEAGFIPDERIRVGLGYNFTELSDDVLILRSEEAKGLFLRVTARY